MRPKHLPFSFPRHFLIRIVQVILDTTASISIPSSTTTGLLAATDSPTMDLNHLDAATRRLVVEIQLQDLQDLVEHNNRKGKGRQGEVTGFVAVLDAYNTELAEAAQVMHDRELCRSICRAVSLDADLIGTALLEEEQARHDRNLALDLETHPEREAEADQHHITDSPNHFRDFPSHFTSPFEIGFLEKLRALYVCSPDDDDDEGDEKVENLPESSVWAASRGPESLSTKRTADKGRECIACSERFRFFELASCAGCAHEYCRDCLKSVFEISLADESYFPPRCCREPIPVELCRLFLPSELVEKFKTKKLEFDTPNRIYCSQPRCSVWIPSQFVENDIATCQTCQSKTCVFCKASSHAGSAECPEDSSTQALLDLAAQEGWQRCYSCKRVVDLSIGCNHISECPPFRLNLACLLF